MQPFAFAKSNSVVSAAPPSPSVPSGRAESGFPAEIEVIENPSPDSSTSHSAASLGSAAVFTASPAAAAKKSCAGP